MLGKTCFDLLLFFLFECGFLEKEDCFVMNPSRSMFSG